MNKSKKFTAWRIVGIVVLALVVIGGFAGAYAMGLRSGAMMDGDTAWVHPMDRYMDEDGEFNESYDSHYPMGFYGRSGRMSHGMGFFVVGRFLGGLLFLAFLGALIRLVFFPMRMARRSMMFNHGRGMHHRGCCYPGHHMHHGMHGFHHYGDGPKDCCGEGECDCQDEPDQDAEEVPEE